MESECAAPPLRTDAAEHQAWVRALGWRPTRLRHNATVVVIEPLSLSLSRRRRRRVVVVVVVVIVVVVVTCVTT